MALASRLFRSRSPQLAHIPKVITFWSPVSAGKTTVAAALARALAFRGSRVALYDFDLWTPSLPRAASSLDAVASQVLHGTLEPKRFLSTLQRVPPAGLHLLAGADDPLRAEALSRDHFHELIAAGTEIYDTVVIDTGRMLSLVATLAAIDAADLLLLPVLPHTTALRHVARYLSLLETDFQVQIERVRLLLNYVSPSADLTRESVESLLGRRIHLVVPHRREWARGTDADWPAPLLPDHLTALLHTPAARNDAPLPEDAHASD